MNLKRFYDFMKVLHIKRSYQRLLISYSYSIYYDLFTIRQILKHNNYFEQKINMSYFIQANGYDMNIYAKIQYMNNHVVL
jgi:hypothetical protein